MRNTLAAVALASCVSGCGWIEQHWPWARREVPVTEPKQTNLAALRDGALSEPLPDANERARPSAGRATTRPAPSRPPTRPAPLGTGEVVAAVLLRVNDTFYTVADVIALAGADLAALDDDVPPGVWRMRARNVLDAAMRRESEMTLVAAEARTRLSDQQRTMLDAEVAEYRDELIAEAGGSEVALRRKMQRMGTSLEAQLDQYRRSLTVQSYLQHKFRPQIDVTRRDLWLYYRRHRDEFSSHRQVQMQLIAAPFAAFDDPSREQARQTIEQARAALRAGRSFADVAREYSRGVKAGDGGVWPMMSAGNFRIEPVERAAFDLDEGRVSDVIATDEGFYIVKARQVRPGRVVPFAEAQKEIRRTILAERQQELTREYYGRLAEKAVVVRNGELMDVAVRRAQERFYQPAAE
ncbi:MAG: peptidyl-prolyl cis-trans isomerase [Phycisphaerae bacterium]|nr:peptidyl-prolyl cis-trans isomerase [Phycisphaerae bacterium]